MPRISNAWSLVHSHERDLWIHNNKWKKHLYYPEQNVFFMLVLASRGWVHVCVCVCVCKSVCPLISINSYFAAEAVLWAMGATALVSFSLSMFAMQSKVRPRCLTLWNRKCETEVKPKVKPRVKPGALCLGCSLQNCVKGIWIYDLCKHTLQRTVA